MTTKKKKENVLFSKKQLERISALCLLIAKPLFAYNLIGGWWFTIIGDGAFGALALFDRLLITFVTQLGCVVLCAYGLYKWNHNIQGLTDVDYIIMTCTILLIIFMIIERLYKQHKSKATVGNDHSSQNKAAHNDSTLFWAEAIGGILSIASYYLLAIGELWSIGDLSGMAIAWTSMTFLHVIYCYISWRKGYSFFCTLQIISAAIAAFKLYSLV